MSCTREVIKSNVINYYVLVLQLKPSYLGNSVGQFQVH